MKKILVAATMATLVMWQGALFSDTDDFSKKDGYAWKGYHEYVKLGFTLGYLIGADQAVKELEPFIRQSSYDSEKVEERLPVYNITNAELKERLDRFYEKTENMAVPIRNAVLIICKETHPQKDAKMIEREKEVQRLPPAEQRVERIKDYLKTEVEKGEYPKYEVAEEKIVEVETKKAVPLKTEEQVTSFWFKMLVPSQGVEVKEVMKPDYTLAAAVGGGALVIIMILTVAVVKLKKRSGLKRGRDKR